MSDFTRRIFVWLSQVAGDGGLPATSARLAITLSRYMNRGTGDAWPSIRTLANDLGIAENSVRNVIKAMVSAGHMAVEAGGGNCSNRYRMVIKSDHEEPENPCNKMKGSNVEPLQNSAPHPCNGLHPTPANSCGDPCSGLHPNHNNNHLTNHLKKPSEGETLSPHHAKSKKPARRATGEAGHSVDKSTTDGFAEFWEVYPKRAGKLAAEKAYSRAIKGGATAEQITLSAMRYAAERDREPDPAKRAKYTKNPSTWLNGGHWGDEPAPTFAAHVVDDGQPIAPPANPREGHGFRVMRVKDFLQ